MAEVLFICTGNTCRSPMAEALAKSLAASRPEYAGITFSSRGLHASFGTPASSNAVLALLTNYGLDIGAHLSARLTCDDLERASLVLCMTAAHKEILVKSYPEHADKILALAEASGRGDILDPFLGDLDDYLRCAENIRESIKNIDFLKYL